MMTDEQIATAKSRLENAFLPLKCKAQDWDYKTKMRFKVFDENDNVVFEVPKIVQGDVVDKGRLADLIEQARTAVQAKGYVLA